MTLMLFNAILEQDKPLNESSSYPKICREPCISCKHGILEDKEWTHEAIQTQQRLSVGIDGSLTVMKEAYDSMYTRWL